MKRTLVIIRHAQATNAWGTTDIQRPLTANGHKQAEQLARRLNEKRILFDTLYISAAIRTQETAHALLRHNPTARHHIRETLYLPDLSTITDLTYELDKETCVGIVIHEPTVSEAGAYYARTRDAFPWGVDVATALVLRWDGDWADLTRASAELEIIRGSE